MQHRVSNRGFFARRGSQQGGPEDARCMEHAARRPSGCQLSLHVIAAMLLPLALAQFAPAQATVQASYPLLTNLIDATGNFGPALLLGPTTPPSPPANGVCVNGIYGPQLPGQDVRTPAITTLTPADFELRLEFRMTGFPASGTAPILMCGPNARWIGFQVQPNGTFGLKYNNYTLLWSSATVALGTWYSAVLKYETGTVQLFLDGLLVLQQNVPALAAGGDFVFTTNDFSIGRNHNGCLRNFVVANNTTLGNTAGLFRYGSGCDGLALGGNGVPALGNSAFQLLVSNVPNVQPLALLGFGTQGNNPGVNLGAIGMANCLAYSNLDIGIFGPAISTAGTATFGLPIPASPSLNGSTLTAQGIAFSNTTSLGLASSNGVRLVVGP
jgi:hypothetical protein